MNCDRFPEELLLSYVLEEDSPIERQRVDEHLAACTRCRQDVDLLQSVMRAEADAAMPQAPPSGLSQLLERQAHRRRSPWSLLRQHPSFAAAAAALLALFFSAGFVQGSLMERRSQARDTERIVRAQALPAPPELGLLALQTGSTPAPEWASGFAESIGVVPPVDSL